MNSGCFVDTSDVTDVYVFRVSQKYPFILLGHDFRYFKRSNVSFLKCGKSKPWLFPMIIINFRWFLRPQWVGTPHMGMWYMYSIWYDTWGSREQWDVWGDTNALGSVHHGLWSSPIYWIVKNPIIIHNIVTNQSTNTVRVLNSSCVFWVSLFECQTNTTQPRCLFPLELGVLLEGGQESFRMF